MPSKQLTATLIRFWFWLHLVSTCAIILQPSTPATILGRYSNVSALILACFVLIAPVVWFGTRWLSTRIEKINLNSIQSIGLLVVSAIGIFVMWAMNLGPTSSYVVVRWYFTFMLFTAAIWALLNLSYEPNLHVVSAILGLGSCLLVLLLARQFPGVLWTDEGTNSNLSQTFIKHGHLGFSFFRFASYGAVFSSVHMGLGYWYGLFGLSLEAGRMFTLLIGLMTVSILFLTVRHLYSLAAAWLGLILSVYVILVINFLRSDIGVAFYLALAFFIFVLAQRSGRIGLHAMVGFIVGFSMDGHPSAFRFIAAFAAAYALEYGIALWKRKRFFIYWPFVALILGEAAGLAAYIGVYLLIEPESFLLNLRQPSVSPDFWRIPNILVLQFNAALQNAPILLGTALLGVFIAIQRRTPIDRLLVVVLMVSVIIYGFFFGLHRDYYTLHVLPLLVLLAAGMFDKLQKSLLTEKVQLVFTGITIFLMIWSLGWLAQRLSSRNSQSYDEALVMAETLRPLVGHDENFVGIETFFLRMYDYSNFIEMNAGFLIAREKSIDESAAWDQLSPTSIALVHGYPLPPPPALIDYISRNNFHRLACWTNSKLGKVELFVKVLPPGSVERDTCVELVIP